MSRRASENRAGQPRLWSPMEVCRRLRRHYGNVERQWTLPPLDELVATILSQNTSDRNSQAAFEDLRRRFPDWDAVRRARTGTIAQAIQRGGLAQQKAPRIKAILQQIHNRHGALTLDFLESMPPDEALEYLQGFDGVGPKTAACVLLFSCGMPVMPVDTHVHRVSRRLGLIGPKTTAEQAHTELAGRVSDDHVLEFHLLLVHHGRMTCTARNAKCGECVLLPRCPEGQSRAGESAESINMARNGGA